MSSNLHIIHDIKDICPTLADAFTFQDIDPDLIPNYYQFVASHKQALGEFSSYIGRLHDAPVEQIKLQDDTLTMHMLDVGLADYAAQQFPQANNPAIYKKFPLTIKFNNVISADLRNCSYSGRIRRCKPQAWLRKYTYLYEELISCTNDRIQLGIVLYQNGRRKKYSHKLLLVDAQDVTIIQDDTTIWTEMFGEQELDKYHTYRNR